MQEGWAALVCYAFSSLSRPSSPPLLVTGHRPRPFSALLWKVLPAIAARLGKKQSEAAGEKSDYGDWHMAG